MGTVVVGAIVVVIAGLAVRSIVKDKGKVFSCFACGGGSTMVIVEAAADTATKV